MNEQMQVLSTVASALEQNSIPYMLTGSVAMDYYGVPRMTRDIDLVVEIGQSDATGFISTLGDRFYLEPETIATEISRHGMFNLISRDYVIKVDIIIRKEDPYRIMEFSRRTRVNLDHFMKVWIVSPEDLLLSKLVWAQSGGSDLQIRDAKNMINSVPSMDKAYLRKWAEFLGISPLLIKVTS